MQLVSLEWNYWKSSHALSFKIEIKKHKSQVGRLEYGLCMLTLLAFMEFYVSIDTIEPNLIIAGRAKFIPWVCYDTNFNYSVLRLHTPMGCLGICLVLHSMSLCFINHSVWMIDFECTLKVVKKNHTNQVVWIERIWKIKTT